MKKLFSSVLNGIEKALAFLIAILLMIVALVAYIPIRLIFPMKIVGRKNLRKVKGGKIVASNHFSNFDIILLVVLFYPITFARKVLGKIELGKNWFTRLIFTGFGSILIDRSKVDIKAIKETTKVLNNGKTVIMFPEGTRNKSEEEDTQGLKSGVIFFAQKTDSTIVPVVILHRPRPFRFNKIIVNEGYKIDKTKKCDTKQEALNLTKIYNDTREKYLGEKGE